MQTYIAIIDFTEQGIRAIRQSPERANAFREQAAGMGANVKEIYWTSGGHDGVIVVEAPDAQVADRLFLALGAQGNVRTQTLRAYDAAQFGEIVSNMP